MEELMASYVAHHICSFSSDPQFVQLMSQGGDLAVDVLHALAGIAEPHLSVDEMFRPSRNAAD